MKIKNSNTILISIALLVILIASSVAVFMWHKKIWDFAGYVRDQRQILRNEQSAVSFLSNVDSEIKQIGEYSEFFDQYYTKRDSMLLFIEKLESVSRATNTKMQIQNVAPGEAIAAEYNYMNVTLQSSGSWEDVSRFIKLIEKMPLFVSIKVLNLSYSGGQDSAFWTASMTISTVTN